MRYFDMTVLGKFSVVMADPPWDIHMEVHTAILLSPPLFWVASSRFLYIHFTATSNHNCIHIKCLRLICYSMRNMEHKIVNAYKPSTKCGTARNRINPTLFQSPRPSRSPLVRKIRLFCRLVATLLASPIKFMFSICEHNIWFWPHGSICLCARQTLTFAFSWPNVLIKMMTKELTL